MGKVWMRASEAAALLDVHPNTIRIWSDEGLLPHYRMGARGDRRYRRDEILSYIAKCQDKTAGTSRDGTRRDKT